MLGREWLRELVPALVAQDSQPGLRQRLHRISAAAKPSAGLSGMAVSMGPAAPAASAPGAQGGPAGDGGGGAAGGGNAGAKLLLFVRDNSASRMAFKCVATYTCLRLRASSQCSSWCWCA